MTVKLRNQGSFLTLARHLYCKILALQQKLKIREKVDMKNVEHTFWPDANFLGCSMQFLQAKLSFTMITSNFSGLMNLFYLEGNVPKKWLGNPQDGWINGFSSYNFEMNYEKMSWTLVILLWRVQFTNCSHEWQKTSRSIAQMNEKRPNWTARCVQLFR